ncbi:hypothetical protein BH09ACT8_BH09ACT8_61480 [soil metagenome]
MTTTASFTPTDSLRYLAAHSQQTLDWAIDRLGDYDTLTEGEADDLQLALEGVKAQLLEHLGTHTTRPHVYDDGRAVESGIDLQSNVTYKHVWHPNRGHKSNQPGHRVGPFKTRRNRHSVLVTSGENLAVYTMI